MNKKRQKTPEERSQGLGCRFWKGYFFHVMDAIFVNEPGSERSQVEDEAFLKLFNKRQKVRFIQNLNKRGEHSFRDTLLHINITILVLIA